MAGIYIHIPFCKQACNYCDFHFSTSLKLKDALINSIIEEIEKRKENWKHYKFNTIYFGGGTPSIVKTHDIDKILNKLYKNFAIDNNTEITLEGNPDDLNIEKLTELKTIGINRLSIGIQSFFEDDLKKLNRSHNAKQAKNVIVNAQNIGFNNITIDLIYGIPGLNNNKWIENIHTAIKLGIPHISAYALTVEKKTILDYQIKKKIFPPVSEKQSAEQFKILRCELLKNNFLHYEISNFAKKNYLSIHNTNYWKNIAYLGLGPSAHSFQNNKRRWNISNNSIYIKNLNNNKYFEEEILSNTDLFNEMIMTGLRTMWGVDLNKIKLLGQTYFDYLNKESLKFINKNQLIIKNNHLLANKNYLFLIEGIISELFLV
jgi:oxygen-independent coproporphyrinogen-3 oxidase